MRPLILAITLLLISSCLNAQDSEPNKALKVYSNVWIDRQTRLFDFNASDSIEYSLEINDLQIGFFSPAFNIVRENGDIHEIEFSRLAFGRVQTDSSIFFIDEGRVQNRGNSLTLNRIQIAFRYEYMLRLNKFKSEARWNAYLGFAAQPYLRSLSYQPEIPTQFPYSLLDIGMNFSLVTHLTYNLGDRWFLDVNIPINVAQVQYNRNRTENPSIPLEERTIDALEFTTFPSLFQFRIGAGVRF